MERCFLLWKSKEFFEHKSRYNARVFYDFEKNERTNLGTFRMSDEQPVTDNFIQFSQGVDLEIMKLFSPSLFSFTRSGLHCDLHPRWDANGKMVAFDSIHEGTRQIYICKR